MNLKKITLLVCLFGLSGCCGGGCRYSWFNAGLNQTISNGEESYKVTEVKWSDTFILFKTELSFHDIELYSSWSSRITYSNISGNASFSSPFNIDETNLQNETQIGSDRILNFEGEYTFVFDQLVDDPADFIADEDAYIKFSLPINQKGVQDSWVEIQNDEVTFLTE